MAGLRNAVNQEMDRMGIDIDADRVLSVVQLRNELIRREYAEGRERGIKSESLLAELSASYDMSYQMIYSVTHERR